MEEHNAKIELLRLNNYLDEPILLIGGLAVQRYFKGRVSKDLDLVCSLAQQKRILGSAYPPEDYEIEELQNDLRPSFICHNRANGVRVFLGPKILEREPYPLIDYEYFFEDAIAFVYDGTAADNILVPAAHVLAYSKLLSFIARRDGPKGRRDLVDFANLTNSQHFVLNRFLSFIERTGAREHIVSHFNSKGVSTDEKGILAKSSPVRFQKIFPPQSEDRLQSNKSTHLPKFQGRSLVADQARKTHATDQIIGIIAPISSWSTDYYIQIIRSIRNASMREIPKLQRKLLVFDMFREDYDHAQSIISDAIASKMAGLITINCSIPSIDSTEGNPFAMPIVSITHADTNLLFSCAIMPDHAPFVAFCRELVAGKKAPTAILISKSLENPFKGVAIDRTRLEKKQAFLDAAKAGSLQLYEGNLEELSKVSDLKGCAFVIEVERYDYDTGAQVAYAFASNLKRDSAVICMADNVAIGFIDAMAESIPDWREKGIRISGFDNTREARIREVTSVDYRLETVGLIAYQKIQALIDNPSIGYSEEDVLVKVIERTSTK